MFGSTIGSRYDYWRLQENDAPPRRLHATDPDEDLDEDDSDDIEIEDDDCDDDDLDEELLDDDEE